MKPLPPEVSIPPGLKTVLEWFSRAAVVIQPHDIKQFACFYFNQLLRFRDEKPNLDVFDLVKEFHEANAGVLTSHGTKTHEELLSLMADDYKDYLNEEGILSVLAGADQTEAVVVFRRTDEIKCSGTPCASGAVATCRRRSAFFERVPLSEIEFSSNTVLIKTSSIPCKYMIVVHSEKVPQCIVFQKEPTGSSLQGEALEKPEGLESEETLSLLHDVQTEPTLADTSSTPEPETSNTVDVKSELTELIRKFKSFMSRLVAPQQKSKECSEMCLPNSGPEETSSRLEQPQISVSGESSKQVAGIPPASVQSKASKSGPANPLSCEPEKLTTLDPTCSPVSTSHGPVSSTLTSIAKDKWVDVQRNMKETMSEEAFGEPTVATSCCLHVHQHALPRARRLSQQTHLSCSSRDSSHHTIRPATCGCHWRLCHILLPDTMTCSARSVTAANEHLLAQDRSRVPVYRDVSACSMQADAACACQTTSSARSSRPRIHTAPALLSSDQHYSQSHDAMRPRYLFFKSLRHGRHAEQAVDCQGCMLPATCDENHQCITPEQYLQQQCCKSEEH